ncbi:hypothetical protein HB943_12935 [Listeria weihenstephanensis]|uniref:Uncharacterized protein n=1 Tax=Listeria weihenstephanensis TaxID=1006155 RepID=A0A841Z699_9LIST|nr:hypothetical protein [Listeria weihenstephanensis]MBC1501511.1 hypothetical protein [Listeria weihenstephanensis]
MCEDFKIIWSKGFQNKISDEENIAVEKLKPLIQEQIIVQPIFHKKIMVLVIHAKYRTVDTVELMVLIINNTGKPIDEYKVHISLIVDDIQSDMYRFEFDKKNQGILQTNTACIECLTFEKPFDDTLDLEKLKIEFEILYDPNKPVYIF